MQAQIMLLPGDGIGPEIMAVAEAALQAIAAAGGHDFRCRTAPIGGAAIDATGAALPEETLTACREADAVLLGAVGGPRWHNAAVRPEQGLLDLRLGLGLYANLRPITVHPALVDASPVRPERLSGVDLLIVRELTGGLYFGPRREGMDFAEDVCRYHRSEVERVVRRAAELASRRRGRITLIDKANVLATSRLWRQVTRELIEREWPQLELEILLVDAAAMHLITRPAEFDVIVTENLFGDILTDEAATLSGSLGMLPSASLGDDGPGLFEPAHGSAPEQAGGDTANPFAMLLSTAMMLRWSLGLESEAERLEQSVSACIDAGATTADLGGPLGTRAAGEAVLAQLQQAAA